MQAVIHASQIATSGGLSALAAGLKTLIPLTAVTPADPGCVVVNWSSADGEVRGHFDPMRDLVYVEADFGHEPADLHWAIDLLAQRGYRPVHDHTDDDLLEDGVRIYFEKVTV